MMDEKKCTKCPETKLLKHFVQRAISKKNGKPLYSSWCKKCQQKAQAERVSKQRAERRKLKAEFVCSGCGTKVSHIDNKCQSCAAYDRSLGDGNHERDKVKYKGTINPRFLVRGEISVAGGVSQMGYYA